MNQTLSRIDTAIAGLPHLDIHTLSEDWALAKALEEVWKLLSLSMGQPPSLWKDSAGERMYGAVMALQTRFDLTDPLREDDEISIETTLLSIRKPHAWARTRYVVKGAVKAEVHLLTSFIKRDNKGSNKKFSKVKDIWTADDLEPQIVEDLLARHHAAKSAPVSGTAAMDYEVNRIQDFNTADFLYFKNFVRIAKAAEWRENRGKPTRLNADRMCFYFGNVEDGEIMRAFVQRDDDDLVTELQDKDGRRLFLSQARALLVQIAVR